MQQPTQLFQNMETTQINMPESMTRHVPVETPMQAKHTTIEMDKLSDLSDTPTTEPYGKKTSVFSHVLPDQRSQQQQQQQQQPRNYENISNILQHYNNNSNIRIESPTNVVRHEDQPRPIELSAKTVKMIIEINRISEYFIEYVEQDALLDMAVKMFTLINKLYQYPSQDDMTHVVSTMKLERITDFRKRMSLYTPLDTGLEQQLNFSQILNIQSAATIGFVHDCELQIEKEIKKFIAAFYGSLHSETLAFQSQSKQKVESFSKLCDKILSELKVNQHVAPKTRPVTDVHQTISLVPFIDSIIHDIEYHEMKDLRSPWSDGSTELIITKIKCLFDMDFRQPIKEQRVIASLQVKNALHHQASVLIDLDYRAASLYRKLLPVLNDETKQKLVTKTNNKRIKAWHEVCSVIKDIITILK